MWYKRNKKGRTLLNDYDLFIQCDNKLKNKTSQWMTD
jgi:hypothetical protein